jgi:fructose-1,6-bisphosphatase/inositol monophosphatase family enzyme
MNRLSQLTLNTEGFIFDPASGESFTANATGLFILNRLREHKSPETIAQELSNEYEVTQDEAERDITDFQVHLRTYKLLS